MALGKKCIDYSYGWNPGNPGVQSKTRTKRKSMYRFTLSSCVLLLLFFVSSCKVTKSVRSKEAEPIVKQQEQPKTSDIKINSPKKTLTTDEKVYNYLLVFGPIAQREMATYKIPAINDMPKKFNVEIFKKGSNVENVVNKQKTTGEPPLMLAMSVFFAIKDAIASVSNYQKIPELDAPATPEKILMSINKIKNII